MGLISSGGIYSGLIGNAVVFSGSMASGQVSTFHIASGGVLSGNIASGQIGVSHIAAGAVRSGSIGSGQISTFHITSGGLGSGIISSGQLLETQIASGVLVSQSRILTPISSGSPWAVRTCEMISGIRAVRLDSSGQVRIAMASMSGKMPAIGIVVDNVNSGDNCNVHLAGFCQGSSGLVTFSGIGVRLFVGRSGQIAAISGNWSSGGWGSGDYGQIIGVSVNSGGFYFNVYPLLYSGGAAGALAGQPDNSPGGA